MKSTGTPIEGLVIFEPKKFGDHRGFFMESFNLSKFHDLFPEVNFCQDNQSLSEKAFTLRGLHFQKPPFAQDKLVRVLAGRILDVAVDLRKDSPTFLHHFTVELSAENCLQLFVPKGFAHGLITLEPNTEVLYKVSAPYSADHDAGFIWDDETFKVDWAINELPILSIKDTILESYSDAKNPF